MNTPAKVRMNLESEPKEKGDGPDHTVPFTSCHSVIMSVNTLSAQTTLCSLYCTMVSDHIHTVSSVRQAIASSKLIKCFARLSPPRGSETQSLTYLGILTRTTRGWAAPRKAFPSAQLLSSYPPSSSQHKQTPRFCHYVSLSPHRRLVQFPANHQ